MLNRRINASVITTPCASTTARTHPSESRAHPHVRVRPRRRGPHPLTSHLNAQAATQFPGTIPSLEGWTPASGTWTPASGLQIVHTDSAEAAGVSALLSRALADSGITGITDGTSDAPSTNAVSLTIDPSQSTLGDEGYQLTVTGNGAQVVAATRAGLLWGARTLEQAVRSGKGTVPTGSITDIPRFPDRGVTLCACGTHIAPDWINRQIDRMQ